MGRRPGSGRGAPGRPTWTRPGARWSGSASPSSRRASTAISPGGSGSGRSSPGRWRPSRSCWRSTSRPTGWTRRPSSPPWTCSATCTPAGGLAVVMVSHRLDAVANYARRLAFVDQEQGLFRVGPLEEMLRPEPLSALYGRAVEVREEGGRRFVHPVAGGAAVSALGGFLAAREIWRAAAGVGDGRGAARLPRRLRGAAADRLRLGGADADLDGGAGGGASSSRSLHVEAEHAHHQLGMAMGFAVAGACCSGRWWPRRLPAEAGVGIASCGRRARHLGRTAGPRHPRPRRHGLRQRRGGAGGRGHPRRGACAGLLLQPSSKGITFASFDPETATALGLRVRTWDAVLSLTVGLAIPASARALGALPVFALLTLPASAALLPARGSRPSSCWPRSASVAAGRIPRLLVRRDADRRHHGAGGGARLRRCSGGVSAARFAPRRRMA